MFDSRKHPASAPVASLRPYDCDGSGKVAVTSSRDLNVIRADDGVRRRD